MSEREPQSLTAQPQADGARRECGSAAPSRSESAETLVYDAAELGFGKPDPLVHRLNCPDAPRAAVRVHGLRQTPESLRTFALRSCPRCREIAAPARPA